MRGEKIHLEVKTRSNMFIGGTPATFEIGGIDLHTITDYKGKPYIPASTIKGKMRSILREIIESGDNSRTEKIKKQYEKYLDNVHKENKEKMKTISIGMDEKKEIKINDKITKIKDKVSAEYLFGIEGFNQTPKLIFNDLKIQSSNGREEDVEQFFSYDIKNNISVNEEGAEINANPRSYKAVRPDVIFEGDILFYNMDKLGIGMDIIRDLIITICKEFNTGIYRIGNSGSRGYGKVHVEAKIEKVS